MSYLLYNGLTTCFKLRVYYILYISKIKIFFIKLFDSCSKPGDLTYIKFLDCTLVCCKIQGGVQVRGEMLIVLGNS